MLQQPSGPKLVASYVKIPQGRQKEFWTPPKIEHIRALALSGKPVRVWTPQDELSSRPLDRLRFLAARDKTSGLSSVTDLEPSNGFDTSVDLAYGRIRLEAPIYQGDMSFGALSGIANVALAKTADLTNTLTGTGEGGLHSEVRKCKRITVQWASARFGVDIDVLNTGLGVVIKIGQGAKPGIGGHLPGAKVTEPISTTRRIPINKDAISPAPHHDIYSIEDLGQRIWALKEATGKPVFVKVGVTNYIPYIASGVARMGGDGIILDASGAGTGAAPSIVKDNVGLPVEIAVAAVDRILRKEGLRDGFSVIAAGKVSNAEDTAKLIALGADAVSIGTASLMALGCLMVHKCHIGFCPAVLTNKIEQDPARVLSLDKAVEWSVNLVRGWNEELKLILEEVGVRSLRELLGRRDLLRGYNMNGETLQILGVKPDGGLGGGGLVYKTDNEEFWTEAKKNRLRELAGTMGRTGGEAVISSMGSVGPPFVDTPKTVCDWIACDGAQVTRPSIDPYREEIETAVYLGRGRIRLSSPIIFAPLREEVQASVVTVLAQVANSMGLLMDLWNNTLPKEASKYLRRVLVKAPLSEEVADYYVEGAAGLVLSQESLEGDLPRAMGILRSLYRDKLIFLRVPSTEETVSRSLAMAKSGVDGLIIDWDMGSGERPIEVEVATAEVDKVLRGETLDGLPLRNSVSLIVESSRIRGADDIFKIMGLGADAVGLSTAALIAIGHEGAFALRLDAERARDRLENLVFSLQKEVKLLAGAAGVSRLYTSLVGSRELLRSVDLEPEIRRRLLVKPAGVG